jgi:hypothetical protein
LWIHERYIIGVNYSGAQPFNPSRAIMRSTVLFDHTPPRGGSTPWSVRAFAIARDDWPTIGSRTGLKASSRAAAASAIALACAGLPSFTPELRRSTALSRRRRSQPLRARPALGRGRSEGWSFKLRKHLFHLREVCVIQPLPTATRLPGFLQGLTHCRDVDVTFFGQFGIG